MNKRLLIPSLVLGIAAIALACFARFGWLNRPGAVKIDTSSVLMDTINISELSTAEFDYKGIAEVYSDEARTKLKARVCYSTVVKAGIDMKDVKLEVDNNNKTVTAILPDIELKVAIIDEESMAILPSDADVDIGSMLKFSKEDAENEARKSEELISTAKENLKANIEGLLFPILKVQGYSLEWK